MRNSLLRDSYIAVNAVALMVGSGVLGAGINQFLINDKLSYIQVEEEAIRDSNLLIQGMVHRDSEKMLIVQESPGSYLSNEQQVYNILSSIEGSGYSEIIGVGVGLENTNLFLMNPNGVLFDPNSILDIPGDAFTGVGNRFSLGNVAVNALGENGEGTVLMGGNGQGQDTLPGSTLTYISERSTITANGSLIGDIGQVIQSSPAYIPHISQQQDELAGLRRQIDQEVTFLASEARQQRQADEIQIVGLQNQFNRQSASDTIQPTANQNSITISQGQLDQQQTRPMDQIQIQTGTPAPVNSSDSYLNLDIPVLPAPQTVAVEPIPSAPLTGNNLGFNDMVVSTPTVSGRKLIIEEDGLTEKIVLVLVFIGLGRGLASWFK